MSKIYITEKNNSINIRIFLKKFVLLIYTLPCNSPSLLCIRMYQTLIQVSHSDLYVDPYDPSVESTHLELNTKKIEI